MIGEDGNVIELRTIDSRRREATAAAALGNGAADAVSVGPPAEGLGREQGRRSEGQSRGEGETSEEGKSGYGCVFPVWGVRL